MLDAIEIEELARFRTALGLTPAEAIGLVRDESVELFSEGLTGVLQRGEISDDEIAYLKWLQDQLGLVEADLLPHWRRIDEAKRLARFRSGHLPAVATRKILEGGETCHFERDCTYHWSTATRRNSAAGELVITDKRIMFISSTKSTTVNPRKIADVQLLNGGLNLVVSSGGGAGYYRLSNPVEAEAVLVGVVKKHRFLQAEHFSSTQSRHIPPSVRREVWARDRGRCVQCKASDYLEFDHIIPFAKGGASSLNNVQLLCRRCNQQKSDRIG